MCEERVANLHKHTFFWHARLNQKCSVRPAVLRDRKASTSYIQRRLSVGYNKAASLIERMEQEGLISPANHAGKREILVPAEDETI